MFRLKRSITTECAFSLREGHHDKRHKISTAETLLHRATKLPSTSQGKNIEINHVTDALRVNCSVLGSSSPPV